MQECKRKLRLRCVKADSTQNTHTERDISIDREKAIDKMCALNI